MDTAKQVNIASLALPREIAGWIGGAAVYESSGASGAQTVFVKRGVGAYLKIAAQGTLEKTARMQRYFAAKSVAPPVIEYISADRDYLVTQAVSGQDGTSWKYLAEPDRLSAVFGESLRALHELDFSDCPASGMTDELAGVSQESLFKQSHLELISDYIGAAKAESAAQEIARDGCLLKSDALIHGDYCLPNIIIDDWKVTGLIDWGDSGLGDRHYDLAWGLWTLGWNLKTPKYGKIFLDAYGRDKIDMQRLRVCGLLAATE